MRDRVIHGDRSMAILSKLSYLLSGPLSTNTTMNSTLKPVSMMNVVMSHIWDKVNLDKFWEKESMGWLPRNEIIMSVGHVTKACASHMTMVDMLLSLAGRSNTRCYQATK